MQLKKKPCNARCKKFQKLLQSVAIFIPLLIIKFYRLVISPHLSPSCRFSPSCSEYGMEAYRKHGLFKGTYLTLWRIMRCNPWGGSGYDPVP
ncbi:MAG: membrane protein insertion efficiency factor YidD [Rikenellaceae bacterium]